MSPAFEITEAAVLVDRARRLVESHIHEVPATRFFVRVLRQDATGLANVARHLREGDRFSQTRLFA